MTSALLPPQIVFDNPLTPFGWLYFYAAGKNDRRVKRFLVILLFCLCKAEYKDILVKYTFFR